MTVIKDIVGPGGVTVTTEVLAELLVPLLIFALLWTDEVLVAVLVVGIVLAAALVGSAPSTIYTEVPIDHYAALSIV